MPGRALQLSNKLKAISLITMFVYQLNGDVMYDRAKKIQAFYVQCFHSEIIHSHGVPPLNCNGFFIDNVPGQNNNRDSPTDGNHGCIPPHCSTSTTSPTDNKR